MKSIKNEGTAKCPNHCEDFDVEYWSFISADEDPELKDAIIGGELNLFCCPECKTFFHHDAPVVYTDSAAHLMVFVFPHSEKKKEQELVSKMHQDYAAVKDVLFKKTKNDSEPVYVFGLDGLKKVLEKEEERNFESEAVAAASAAAGFQIVRLDPGYARKEGFPSYVPAPAEQTANGFAVAASKVLKSGLKSKLLQNFMDRMSEEGARIPLIL